jgi:benzodiazapine receptor
MPRERTGSLLVLAGFGLATAGAVWYGSRNRRDGSRDTRYHRLAKPRFTPPDLVFPVVWTSLYAMIAWSGWRVWNAAPSRERRRALRLWISHLGASTKWSKLLSGEERPALVLADVIALEGMIFSYMNAARKVDRAAANAFIPYAAWVAFTAVLNSEIARLNPREF